MPNMISKALALPALITLSMSLPAQAQSDVELGGYGEMHYNNLADGTRKLDFHRFVLFFGHEWNDSTRFFSELEIEHALAGESQPGEVELEQAYVEIDLNDKLSTQSGVFLLPIGILNETHEPDTFYGVERNPVEKNIIPTTWWEGGFGINGRAGMATSYSLHVHSGLLVDPTSFNIRSGRQKVANANTGSLAYTASMSWRGVPGMEIGAALQMQDDITQGASPTPASLTEFHIDMEKGSFGLRALYAGWQLNSAAARALNKDQQSGYYLEPSYKFSKKFGIFARMNSWDNSSGTATNTQMDYGINYWPHPKVAFKFDVQDHSDDTKDGFNLGVGYQF
ncbi:MAG: porin [Gammaproteobacteria bacterium]|nr:porin [Gammaproteobacteria bacterium]